MTTTIDRVSRFQGVAQIARFNCPQYVAGAACVTIAALAVTLLSPPRWMSWILAAGIGLAAFEMIASLVVSHIVYDRSKLQRWDWAAAALGERPTHWINIHSGLDESSAAFRRIFPGSHGRVFDMFDPREMTEPSITRARNAHAGDQSERVDFRHLPIADASADAVFLMLSAHELRKHESRVALLSEVRRLLALGGRVIVAEHLRDLANFIAFGPGFLHFHSRATWLSAIADAGLCVENEFSITPFVGVFVLRRMS